MLEQQGREGLKLAAISKLWAQRIPSANSARYSIHSERGYKIKQERLI
jgi:hypothetical protein